VVYLCNRAIHGEYVRPNNAKTILQTGIQLLEHLGFIIEERVVEPIETEPISAAEVEKHRNAKYRVVTIVPLVNKPVRNVRIFNQEGIDSLLEGYGEYAEFLVSVEKVDGSEGKDQKRNPA
jgi:hypothetical protein